MGGLLVHGTAGSGKTTFVKALGDLFERETICKELLI
jgi:Mg-chelatase subunit ChlI